METRNKAVVGALLAAVLVVSHGAFAQGGHNPPEGSTTGQAAGAGSNDTPDQPSATASGSSHSGTLMQKREHGMSANQPASSPKSTGKMQQ
ncbi:MAG TPA: hypothetical protein VGM85_01745 [Paraburkholderia sp.]|jgi:hypothetical protein